LTDLDYWTNRVIVHCDYSTVKELDEGDLYVVEKAEFNTEDQRGEVILRVATYSDI
jgi:hypothetical protein